MPKPRARLRLRDAAEIAGLRSAFAPVRQREISAERISMRREAVRANSNASAPSRRNRESPVRRPPSDQLDAHVVEGVDQDDEALRLVALARADHGDAVEDEGVKALGELEIVGRAERATAKRVEIEPRDAIDRLRHVEMAAEKLDVGRLAALVAGQRQERRVERGVRLRAERRVVDRGALELLSL